MKTEVMQDKNNSFRKGFYHLKVALDLFDDVVRQSPGSIAGKVAKDYGKRIQWMLDNFATNPQLPQEALQDFKADLNGDILFHEAISEKALNLPAEVKPLVEEMLDRILAGEKIKVEMI